MGKTQDNNVKKGLKPADDERMPLGRRNYVLMLIGFGVIVLGFVLMVGGGSDDPNVFDAERMFSFRRITLAPLLVLGGFAFEIYAIMKSTRGRGSDDKAEKE